MWLRKDGRGDRNKNKSLHRGGGSSLMTETEGPANLVSWALSFSLYT